MIHRCILPDWAKKKHPASRKVIEGKLDEHQLHSLNENYYNIYYLPNSPSTYEEGKTVDGSQIDTFSYVFVDMDLKDGVHQSKESFVQVVFDSPIPPTRIIYSGNGVHVYWKVTDLDAMTYLKLQRRLARYFDTDLAVSKIYQLMRTPGTLNTKDPDNLKPCTEEWSEDISYSSEQLDSLLPILTKEDEVYCQGHFDKTYQVDTSDTKINTKLPVKFGALLKNSQEVKDIWLGNTTDRSEADYRLGHILFASDFTRADALSVLVNCKKAMDRMPKHRVAYATNIIDKIWTYEQEPDDLGLNLSDSIKDILAKRGGNLKGIRFPCYKWLDDTAHGFRLGQVFGLVGGSGVGKTAVALNMFMGFVELNPDYHHFIIPLEQPAEEIAEHWRTMCGEKTYLHDKVHVMSNYDEVGGYRQLSLEDIEAYILKFQTTTKTKIGCVVIDHIGALKKAGGKGEQQDLMDICHSLKPFAQKTQTLLVIQSQTSREKAGIGDLELNKDAAYGTMLFEAYCDYMVTIWQPLKRCYENSACPTITAYKFCKIRHKKIGVDVIREDVRYLLYFDPITECLRDMTQEDETSFNWFNKAATKDRGKDRKTDLVTYVSMRSDPDGEASNNQNPKTIRRPASTPRESS
jgi:hypothetical protein